MRGGRTEVVDEVAYPVRLADRQRKVVGSEAGKGLVTVHPEQVGHASIDQHLLATLRIPTQTHSVRF